MRHKVKIVVTRIEKGFVKYFMSFVDNVKRKCLI